MVSHSSNGLSVNFVHARGSTYSNDKYLCILHSFKYVFKIQFKGSVTAAVCVCTVPHVPCLQKYCPRGGNICPAWRLAAERAV